MNWSRIKNWFNEPLIVKPDLSELHTMLASFTTNLNAVNAAFLKDFKTMADDLDTEVTNVSNDVQALIAAIPGAVQKAVSDALTAAGTDTAAQTALLAQVDANLKTELATIAPPAPEPTT